MQASRRSASLSIAMNDLVRQAYFLNVVDARRLSSCFAKYLAVMDAKRTKSFSSSSKCSKARCRGRKSLSA